MGTRRLLIALPLVLVALLLQSAFWVPTYENQTAASPRRLTTYIEATIGDAKLLNPTISSDGASSQVSGHVFERLLDVDEDNQLVPDLAERWTLGEEAYLAANPARELPGGGRATAPELAAAIRAALAGGPLADLADVVQSVSVLPGEERTLRERVAPPAAAGGEPAEPVEAEVRVRVPARVKLALSRVEPDLFERLAPVIGQGYLERFPHGAHIRVEPSALREALRPRFPALLPAAEHNPVIEFELRRDVRFHDGHPFDAGDVKFTYDAIMDPVNLSPRASDFEPIARVEVLGPHRVRVVYKRLHSPAIIFWVYMGIIPEHLMNRAALEREMDRRGITGEARENFGLRNSETARHPIGTGPFRFVEWQSDQYIHLERNPDYWGDPPEYRDVYFRVVPDLVTQEVEFRAGAVDSYTAQPHQVARYREDERYQALSVPASSYSYIAYNLRKPLFRDPRVRRALAMAIDVDEIIHYVLYDEGQRTSGPYYVTQTYYDPDTPLVPYDPEGALALLAEAGWRRNAEGWLQKDGKRLAFTLVSNQGNPQRKAIMTIAQNAWRRIGVECSTQVFEWTVFLEDILNALAFDAVILAWTGGALDPDHYSIWHSSQTDPYELNFSGYQSAEADALIERIRREYDPQRQIALARRLHRRIAEDQPFTFLYAPRSTLVLDQKIVLVERDPDGAERYRKIYPTRTGRITDHFERWRKLPRAPAFEERG